MRALANMWGKEAHSIHKRYYRSYIRAFNDAKDASPARKGHEEDDDYVTQSEFRLLLVYLEIYATWYEVFMGIDGGTEGITIEDDHRLSVRPVAHTHGCRRTELPRQFDPIVRCVCLCCCACTHTSTCSCAETRMGGCATTCSEGRSHMGQLACDAPCEA